MLNSTVFWFVQFHRHVYTGLAPAPSRVETLSEKRRRAANCRWAKHAKHAKDAHASDAKLCIPRARVLGVLKEKELEKELETAPASAPPASAIYRQNKPRRAWVDRDAARAAGSDRYWAERVGERYWAAKRVMHSAARFWSRYDALKLGQYLERCPAATLDDVREVLLNPRPAYQPQSWQSARDLAAERLRMRMREGLYIPPAETLARFGHGS